MIERERYGGRSVEDGGNRRAREDDGWEQVERDGGAEEPFRVWVGRTRTVTVTVTSTAIADPSKRTATSMDRGRPPPPAFRRDRRRSTTITTSTTTDSSPSPSRTIASMKTHTLPTPTSSLHNFQPRAAGTSIIVPVPITYQPFVNNSPADTTASDSSSSTQSTTTTSTAASAMTTTSCTENCYLPVQVDERVLPIRYTQGSDGYWTRDMESWVIFGRISTVAEEADASSLEDIAAAAAAAADSPIGTEEDTSDLVTSNSTVVAVNATEPTNATSLDTATTVGDPYEILATLPKGWGSTSERSAVYRVPLIIVASMVLALIMVAFIVIVIVNRSKARRRQARRKRRAARLAAAAASNSGPNATANASPNNLAVGTSSMPGNTLLGLFTFRPRRTGGESASVARANGTARGVPDIDDDDSDDTSSIGLSEKVGAGLRRRRGGKARAGLRWRIKRERDVGGTNGEGHDGRITARETLIIEGGTRASSKALFKEKVVRWKAGLRKRRNVIGGGEDAEGDDSVLEERTPAEAAPGDLEHQSPTTDLATSPIDPETSSLHSADPSSHAIGSGPGSGTTPDTSYITAPVSSTFFLPAYRAASVHAPEISTSMPISIDRNGGQERPGTPPPEIGTSAAGASGSSHLAGSAPMADAEGSSRAFEKSPARYYSAPTTTEQEDALGVAFGVGVGVGVGAGGASGAVTNGQETEEGPSANANVSVENNPITGHLATDDKRLLERLRNAGSGPSASSVGGVSRADGSAPVLDVDEDGFERHQEDVWEPSEPVESVRAGMDGGLEPSGLPEPPRAISQPSYAAFVSEPSRPSAPPAPSAPSVPGGTSEEQDTVAVPSAPALFEDELGDDDVVGLPSAPAAEEEEDRVL